MKLMAYLPITYLQNMICIQFKFDHYIVQFKNRKYKGIDKNKVFFNSSHDFMIVEIAVIREIESLLEAAQYSSLLLSKKDIDSELRN